MSMRYFCDQCHLEVPSSGSTVVIVYVKTTTVGDLISKELRFCNDCTKTYIISVVKPGPSDAPDAPSLLLKDYPFFTPALPTAGL